ncbi:hypothetical protein HOO65_100078 [Ceratocystis lukuohia]
MIFPLSRAVRLQSHGLVLRFARPYSSASSTKSKSLIQVIDLPAPNSGHIRILELNRPEARNAISVQLLADLRQQIDVVAAQYGSDGEELPQKPLMGGSMGENKKGATRALILASAVESCFCAGADLKERRSFSSEETERFLSFLRSTLSSISSLPIPTISAISSLALGGGLELALSTTFRVLSSTAAVGLPETRLGIIPGAGGTYRLPALIGLNRARDMILTGRRVSASEAYFLGLADRLVEVAPEGEEEKKQILDLARRAVLSESVRLAQEICDGGPIAVRAALEAVQWANPDVENKMYQRVVSTEDRDEALKAFSEKRKPVFSGR